MSAIGTVQGSPAIARLDRTGRALLAAVLRPDGSVDRRDSRRRARRPGGPRPRVWPAGVAARARAAGGAAPRAADRPTSLAPWPGARSRGQVALWIEARVPSLRYALATLADPRLPPSSLNEHLERIVEAASWTGTVRDATVRALRNPVLLLLTASLTLLYLPRATVFRVARPHPGDVLDAVTPLRSRGSALTPWSRR